VGWIGTSTRTAQLNNSQQLNYHRSDWDIDMINSNNFKGSVYSDWDIELGLHNSIPPSTRATKQTAKNQHLSSPRLKEDTTNFVFPFFQLEGKQRGKRRKKELSQRPPTTKHQAEEAR
jgi:hypothetical protein